nr:unnamed protein product [Callosobruchus chinensis]
MISDIQVFLIIQKSQNDFCSEKILYNSRKYFGITINRQKSIEELKNHVNDLGLKSEISKVREIRAVSIALRWWRKVRKVVVVSEECGDEYILPEYATSTPSTMLYITAAKLPTPKQPRAAKACLIRRNGDFGFHSSQGNILLSRERGFSNPSFALSLVESQANDSWSLEVQGPIPHHYDGWTSLGC